MGRQRTTHFSIENSRVFSSRCGGLPLSYGVGASHRVNLIAPFPLGQNCLRKLAMTMSMTYGLLTILFGQDGWILAKFSFCVFMDRDGVVVHKHAKK